MGAFRNSQVVGRIQKRGSIQNDSSANRSGPNKWDFTLSKSEIATRLLENCRIANLTGQQLFLSVRSAYYSEALSPHQPEPTSNGRR